MRLAAIKRIRRNNGKVFPSYNVHACNWFKLFDEINSTNGMYGPNEYLIEELGYWPDYINFDVKLIIEWDESYHRNQEEKDKQRQKEIQKHFSDFEFIRIKRF